MQPLTPSELTVVGWIEQYWHRESKFPNFTSFKRKFGQGFEVSKLLEKPAFIRAMNSRGINVSLTPDGPVDLNSEQMAAVLALTNYLDKRSPAAKLKSLGISQAKWQGWLKDPNFKDYLHELSSRTFKDSIHLAEEGLAKRLETGDPHAIKLYMELTGRIQNNGNEVSNLRVILTKLVEVLRRRITDEELLRTIGQDFDLILAGKDPDYNTIESVPVESLL